MAKMNNTNKLRNQAHYEHKTFIQQRFFEVKKLLCESNKNSTTVKSTNSDSVPPGLRPLWIYDNAAHNTVQYHQMSRDMSEKAVTIVEGELNCAITHDTPDYTELSLSFQSTYCEEDDIEFGFGKAAIMVSPTLLISMPLSNLADEVVNVTLFASADVNDSAVSDDIDPWPPSMMGILYFANEDGNSYAYEFDEICLLVEVEESKEYIFTFYSKVINVLFVKHLTSLDDVDLFSDSDKAVDTGK